MAKKQKKLKIDPLAFRELIGENQTTFWHRVGCTQSGGSRYESGRRVPKSTRMLLALLEGTATLDQLASGKLADMV